MALDTSWELLRPKVHQVRGQPHLSVEIWKDGDYHGYINIHTHRVKDESVSIGVTVRAPYEAEALTVDQEEARARFQAPGADCWDEIEDDGAENRMHRAGSEKIPYTLEGLITPPQSLYSPLHVAGPLFPTPASWAELLEDELPPL